jgi:hypothetical protein
VNLPLVTKGANGITFVYRRESAALDQGFVDAVEYSNLLSEGSWSTAVQGVNGVTISSVDLDADTEEVTVTIPTTGSRTFARLKVTAPQ